MSSARTWIKSCIKALYTGKKGTKYCSKFVAFTCCQLNREITALMANNLRKFKYTRASSSAGPKAPSPSDSPTGSNTSSPQHDDQTGMADLKVEILTSLKKDIATMLRLELKSVLSEEFDTVKTELHAVKTEVANNTAAMRSEVEKMKATISDMEHGLSSCSDDMTSLLTKVGKLETEVTNLREKCLDLEGRMRRSNIRILNVPETPGSSTPAAVSKLLKEVLKLDKDVLIDRSQRGLQARRTDGKPRVIVARVHYYQDCVDILRRARESRPLQFKGAAISIFPDYPPSVAQARSAFNEVRRLLRGQDSVKYGLVYPARLRVTHNGTERQFQSPVDAMAYVKTKILQDVTMD